jgi:hypothetical protein
VKISVKNYDKIPKIGTGTGIFKNEFRKPEPEPEFSKVNSENRNRNRNPKNGRNSGFSEPEPEFRANSIDQKMQQKQIEIR